MDDYGPLFSSGTDEGPPTWGVLDFNRAVESALKQAFPGEFWIRGEIQGLARTRQRKHWYFELVEKDPSGDQPLARVSIALLGWNRSKVEREMRAAPGFELDDDVEVRIRCQIGFYPPWGKFQLTMVGVDPAFTLGQMAANRERILRVLAAENLLERNASIPLPLVPCRVGLVTSVGSAAYNDFVDEIRASDFAFTILACDARVQGAETESTVVAGIRELQRHHCDVIVVSRGGGSRSDLAGFDSESIARAIATCRVPVLTGIGHEIDTSLADVVAHRDFKTPTACADFLVDRVGEAFESFEGLWASIVDKASSGVLEEHSRLQHLGRGCGMASRHALELHRRDLQGLQQSIGREVRASHARRSAVLSASLRQARDRVRRRMATEVTRLEFSRRRIAPERLQVSLVRRSEALSRVARQLGPRSTRRLKEQQQRIHSIEHAVRALDPRRVLERGYALAVDSRGRTLKSVDDARVGDPLSLRLADGSIAGTIDRIEKSPLPLNPEETQ